jgi:hypothetical protein
MPRGKNYDAYRQHLLSTFLPEDGAG